MQIDSRFWEFASNIETLINILSALIVFIISVYSFLKIRSHNSVNYHLKKWLGNDAPKSLKYYVNTRAQLYDPCESDEIKKGVEYDRSIELLSFFLNTVFKNIISDQYFILLGDSGMGKTTFMIKLYKRYSQKILKKYKIILIPLSYDNALPMIYQIGKDEGKDEKHKTILLLDGLDENPDAVKDYEIFIQKLLTATEMYYKVIITCRTQFFPDEKSEPHETGKINYSTINKKKLFNKLYISPFNDNDISHFLSKKYPPFLYRKRKKAMEIIQKCPYLMVRPMLLAYIDDLIDIQRNYEYLYQIYDQLVKNWIKRESIPADILYNFTKQTAVEMYNNNSVFIDIEEISKLCKKYNINIEQIEARTRSLLNRNGLGQYKFAHKSIYEFILAKEVLENMKFREIYDFSNFDMAQIFLDEMLMEMFKTPYGAANMNYDFTGLRLKNLNLNDIDFESRVFCNAVFEDCTFCNSIIGFAQINQCQFINCDFTKIDLSESNLIEVQFISCDLQQAKLQYSTMRNCIILDSNLRNCNLDNAHIFGSRFTKSDLSYSNLCDTDLKGSIFEKMVIAPIVYRNIQADSKLLDDIIMANKLLANIKQHDYY